MKVQDVIVASQGRDVSQSEVIIVAIDDKSIAALGGWPWRRQLHAELIIGPVARLAALNIATSLPS